MTADDEEIMSQTAPTAPAKRYYYEDLDAGQSIDCGRRIVTRDEIIAFARAYDPQPHHLDDEAAARTMVGRLCASGWHTCALFMRLLCDSFYNEAAGLGSPGLDEVRWLKPVFPGDTISGRFTCASRRTSASRPGVGIWVLDFEVRNQHDETIMTWRSTQLMKIRATVTAA
jgi:acyl dehydratase